MLYIVYRKKREKGSLFPNLRKISVNLRKMDDLDSLIAGLEVISSSAQPSFSKDITGKPLTRAQRQAQKEALLNKNSESLNLQTRSSSVAPNPISNFINDNTSRNSGSLQRSSSASRFKKFKDSRTSSGSNSSLEDGVKDVNI